MNRRGFLGSILAAAAAPAIVRADSLMRIVPAETSVLVWPIGGASNAVLASPTFTGAVTYRGVPHPFLDALQGRWRYMESS